MDAHKAAAYAQILAFPCAAYCAYGTWAALHPGEALPVNSTALAISLGAFAACGIVILLERLAVATRKKKPEYDDPTLPPALEGHRLAEVAFARHWRGMAEGSADELTLALNENLELLKVSEELTNQLKTAKEAAVEGQKELAQLTQEVEWLRSEDYRKFWQWIGVVRDYAVFAEVCDAKLEAVWHLWNNSGERLIYPLSASAIPDPDRPLSWNQRQLLEFRILYRQYLGDMGSWIRTFTRPWLMKDSLVTAPIRTTYPSGAR